MIKFIPLTKNVSISGLPKIHKLNVQGINLSLHPIISSIGTYNYHFSKFVNDLLDPIITTSNCTIDSFTFCEEIRKVSVTNRFLVSYDVCSLFTSIPLKKTIDVACNLLFEHNSGSIITIDKLKKPFECATSDTYFISQGTFYYKIDDVTMGSPLGLALANLSWVILKRCG